MKEKMKKVRITVLETTLNEKLAEKYGNKTQLCELHKPGQQYVSNGWQKPDGLCDSAWKAMESFVFSLSHGSCNFFDGWMKKENQAVISCNDGLRPVIFLLERTNEDSYPN